MSSSVCDTPNNSSPTTAMPPAIRIRGARTHTLQNVSCRIPTNSLTVITGVSGSGKSSLAFDTLYAEGQRRYVASLSTYARQFLERMDPPDVDSIEGILPAIALEQKNGVTNARSTVGTATDLDDYLRLLFAAIADIPPDPSALWQTCTPATWLNTIHHAVFQTADTPWLILAPLWPTPEAPIVSSPPAPKKPSKQKSAAKTPTPETGDLATTLDNLPGQGIRRVWFQQTLYKLPEDSTAVMLAVTEAGPLKASDPNTLLWAVIDRWTSDPDDTSRLSEAVANAHALTGSHKLGLVPHTTDPEAPTPLYLEQVDQPRPSPHVFSFNSPLGACPTCEGFGRIIGLDLAKVIPNPSKTLEEGAIHPLTTPANTEYFAEMLDACKRAKIPTNTPYAELSDAHKTLLLDGMPGFEGIKPYFDWLESKRYKVHVRVMLAKYRGYFPCGACGGSRLRKEAQAWQIAGQTLWACNRLPLDELKVWVDTLNAPETTPLTPAHYTLTVRLRRELTQRLQHLLDVGLDYLTLARPMRTLSGGESQRIHLAGALGTALTDTLYVLDEPTVGLHSRDTQRLIGVMRAIRDLGNTVVVVEHDPEVMQAADHIIDMGPEGGRDGGRLLYEGPYAGLLTCPTSLTGQFLTQPTAVTGKPKAGTSKTPPIRIVDASGHNLQNVTVSIPTGQLVGVIGVSGSGKSTLIRKTLYTGAMHQQAKALDEEAVPFEALEGIDQFDELILVDQQPPGRSSRSNPATYLKVFDDIRKRFSESRKAMFLGLSAGDFSFNTPGGRCETCEGMGTVTIDMQFMADVHMTCPDCKGRRFQSSVLAVEYKGKSIDEVLALTIREALAFFADEPGVLKKLQPLADIGLDYIQLGQPTSTLSGGEAQRLKLAHYLTFFVGRVAPALFLLDEPTTGLHLRDIDRLVRALRTLVAQGHSVVVIEHNQALINACDWLIEMGPGGGKHGGRVVYEGRPR